MRALCAAIWSTSPLGSGESREAARHPDEPRHLLPTAATPRRRAMKLRVPKARRVPAPSPPRPRGRHTALSWRKSRNRRGTAPAAGGAVERRDDVAAGAPGPAGGSSSSSRRDAAPTVPARPRGRSLAKEAGFAGGWAARGPEVSAPTAAGGTGSRTPRVLSAFVMEAHAPDHGRNAFARAALDDLSGPRCLIRVAYSTTHDRGKCPRPSSSLALVSGALHLRRVVALLNRTRALIATSPAISCCAWRRSMLEWQRKRLLHRVNTRSPPRSSLSHANAQRSHS